MAEICVQERDYRQGKSKKKSELIVALGLCITRDIVANCRSLFALAFSVAQNDTTPAVSIKIVEGAL